MSFSKDRDVLLIDGSGFIFRAFYAIPYLTNGHGFPTNALFGFAKMLEKVLAQFDPKFVGVVFDSARENFRHELYSAYKANRVELPPELALQMPYFRPLCEALGIPTFGTVGYEADDIIGTIANTVSEPVVIVTGDKDFAQLVNDRIILFDPAKDRWGDVMQITEAYEGVTPAQFIDYLSLVGDTSDNIPGVKGIGPKGAAQLLNHFGSVEAILSRIDEITEIKAIRSRNTIINALKEHRKELELSRVLAAIKCDVPLQTVCGKEIGSGRDVVTVLVRREPHLDDLSELVTRFEFKDLFSSYFVDKSEIQREHFESITIWKEDIDAFFERLSRLEVLAFDVETTSLNAREASVVGVSFCIEMGKAYYIPCGHVRTILGDGSDELDRQIPWEELRKYLKKLFEEQRIKVVGQNCKYDLSVMTTCGVVISEVYFDTMIAAWVMYPDRQSYGMDKLAHDLLGYSCISFDQVVGSNQTFAEVTISSATRYAAEDAWVTWRLYEYLEKKLKEHALDSPFFEFEMPLVPVLRDMELRGIALDKGVLEGLGREWRDVLLGYEERIYRVAGTRFNLNSPIQLSEIMYGKLGLPTKGIKKTQKGYSTDSSALEKLARNYELPELMLAYRHLHKLLTTYVEAIPRQVDPLTGRIHSNFRQTGTGTGRLSSSDPNLQNIPIATAEGRRIRQAFVAAPGYVFVAADYSQIELRLLAHLSGDESLLESFRADQDIHTSTARELLRIAPGVEVTKEQRRIGKTMNFGIIYGMSAFRLGQELGIPIGEAQNYIDTYFSRYKGVKVYFDECKQQAESHDEVRTISGRRRVLTEISGIGERDTGFLNRVALNAPIQGSAADVVKFAMIRMYRVIREQSLDAHLVLQVHDELIYEVNSLIASEFKKTLKDCMENVIELRVPLRVEVSQGTDWDEAGR